MESLDRIFTNVCELDLIFRPDEVSNCELHSLILLESTNECFDPLRRYPNYYQKSYREAWYVFFYPGMIDYVLNPSHIGLGNQYQRYSLYERCQKNHIGAVARIRRFQLAIDRLFTPVSFPRIEGHDAIIGKGTRHLKGQSFQEHMLFTPRDLTTYFTRYNNTNPTSSGLSCEQR